MTVQSEPNTRKINLVIEVCSMNLDTYAIICNISVHAVSEVKRPARLLKKLILLFQQFSQITMRKKCLRAYADSEGLDQPVHPGLQCLLTESLDTTECMNGAQRPG